MLQCGVVCGSWGGCCRFVVCNYVICGMGVLCLCLLWLCCLGNVCSFFRVVFFVLLNVMFVCCSCVAGYGCFHDLRCLFAEIISWFVAECVAYQISHVAAKTIIWLAVKCMLFVVLLIVFQCIIICCR